MKAATALVFFALPLLGLAQSNSTNSSQALITSTSLSAFVTLGPNRQISSGTSTIVLVFTAAPTQSASSNNTLSSNSTVSANSTASASRNSTSTSQSSVNLPTAPTTIAAGGGPGGAPLPGASGGAFGPDDKYIAAASSLARNTMLVGVGGLVLTGALMVL